MALVRCTRCNGRKNVLGLGGMRKACPDCKGIGFVEPEAELTASQEKRIAAQSEPVKLEALVNAKGVPVVAKRKGRPPRSLETAL